MVNGDKKMKVSLSDVKQAFDDLIEEKKSREEVASWAAKLMFAHDDCNLEFEPSNAKDKIWRGLDDLTFADAMNVDKSYFYSIKDFIN